MSHHVTVRHNFETAHRLPHLGGKCRNLHGHSWWVEVTATADALDDAGTVVEFGAFKARLREWIDTHLDHGAMLGHTDPLVPALTADGSKVHVFPHAEHTSGLPYPTVEAVAVMLARAATCALPPHARVTRVRVTETHVNAAEWTSQ